MDSSSDKYKRQCEMDNKTLTRPCASVSGLILSIHMANYNSLPIGRAYQLNFALAIL